MVEVSAGDQNLNASNKIRRKRWITYLNSFQVVTHRFKYEANQKILLLPAHHITRCKFTMAAEAAHILCCSGTWVHLFILFMCNDLCSVTSVDITFKDLSSSTSAHSNRRLSNDL